MKKAKKITAYYLSGLIVDSLKFKHDNVLISKEQSINKYDVYTLANKLYETLYKK